MTSLKDPEGAELRALGALVDFSRQRVLEIGCGDGRMTWLYAEEAADVLAVDSDAESIHEAHAALPNRLRNRVEFRVIEAESLDVPRQRFDIAFLSWSL